VRGLAPWLRALEEGRRRRPSPFLSAQPLPKRLCVPVERLLDRDRLLLSGVLLGWSRDGNHLLSYTRRDGEYELHVWRTRPGAASPARLFVSVPLFGKAGGRDAGPFGDDERDLLLLHVVESACGQLLLVHASPVAHDENTPRGSNVEAAVGAEACERLLTVLRAPWSVAACERASLRTASCRYTSVPPHPPFHPSLSLLPDCGVAGRARLLLPTGEGLMELSVSLAAPDSAAEGGLAWAEEPPAAPDAPPPAAQLGARAVLQPLRTFLCEPFLARALAPALAQGFRVVDYTVQLVSSQTGDPGPLGSREPLAILLVVAVLRGGDEAAAGRPLEMLLALQGGTARMLRTRQLRPRGAAELAAGAAAECATLRRAAHAPRRCAAQLPHSSDNGSMLARWRSADVLRHPSLPLAILGFGLSQPEGGGPDVDDA